MGDSCKELLLTSLTKYYKKHPENIKILKKIIDGKYVLSLRMIDWLVTHYSNTQKIYYWIHKINNNIYDNYPIDIIDFENLKKINLYTDYRAQLKSYSKINFDSFRRHNRITFILDTNNPYDNIETTVGQLNFFKWIFTNNVIEYAIKNYDKIYNNMVYNNITTKKKNLIKFNNMRQENIKGVLRFD